MDNYIKRDVKKLMYYCNQKSDIYYNEKYKDNKKNKIIKLPSFHSDTLNYLVKKYEYLILMITYKKTDYVSIAYNIIYLNAKNNVMDYEDIIKVLDFINLIEEKGNIEFLDDELFSFIGLINSNRLIDLIESLLFLNTKDKYYMSFRYLCNDTCINKLKKYNYRNPLLIKLKSILTVKEEENCDRIYDAFVSYAFLNIDGDTEYLKEVYYIFRSHYEEYLELCELNNINELYLCQLTDDSIAFFEDYFDSLISNNKAKQKKLGEKNG